MFIDRLFEGFRGPELKIAHMNMHAIVASLSRISSVPQVNVKSLSTLAFFSSSAAEMISSGQINSSIETEKYREICFNESRLG